MTTKEWSEVATDDLEFLECIGYALQNKADDSESPDQPSLRPHEVAVLKLWTYLAADRSWHPMPVSRSELLESLQLLYLGSIAAKIPEELRSPDAELARELFDALIRHLRAHPELLDLDDYLEKERRWLTKRKAERLWALDNMPAIYRLKTELEQKDDLE
jgi:hypothetical protein